MSDQLESKPIDPAPKLDTATTEKDKLNVSPTGTPVLGQWIAKIGVIVVVLAGAILALPAAGVALPPIVVTLATVVATIGAALGIASPGVRKPPESP